MTRGSMVRPAVVLFAVFTLVTGVLYPLLITGVSAVVFSDQAHGSLRRVDGNVVGSSLIGQPFSKPDVFWSRPSATGPVPYNGASSSGSNLGPTNPALLKLLTERAGALGGTGPVPVDLITASGSGLDPDVSKAAALYQVPRVAKARGLDEAALTALIDSLTRESLIGPARVNVLELNLGLSALSARRP
jgi:potassium-transporting ATPase KdpC subunit